VQPLIDLTARRRIVVPTTAEIFRIYFLPPFVEMQNNFLHRVLPIVSAAFFIFSHGVHAQGDGMSSKDALAELTVRVGDQALTHLVSMKGYEGVPQPAEWEIVTHDPQSPTLLHRYRVGLGYVRDEGPVEDQYPAKEPAGYIDYSQLRLDSIGAFTVAEAAALQAKMGFDSLNMALRCREYSREPVWILHLVNDEGLLVGKVHMSANTGRVFRTIWIYRDDVRGGFPTVVDSALTPPQVPVENTTQNTPQSPLPDPGPPTTQSPVRNDTSPPASIPIPPGDNRFVPPAPAPPVMERNVQREPVPTTRPPGTATPSSTLPPIPPELLQDPTIPDTRIPPPPVPSSDGD